MQIAELRMPFPWGLCFVEDPQFAEEVPLIETRGQLVSVAKTALSIVVLHEVDGEATVRLHLEPFEAGRRILIFDDAIESVSGEIRLADATASAEARAVVGIGLHPIRIYVDQARHPQLVDIVIES
jgi:hypothetical protein